MTSVRYVRGVDVNGEFLMNDAAEDENRYDLLSWYKRNKYRNRLPLVCLSLISCVLFVILITVIVMWKRDLSSRKVELLLPEPESLEQNMGVYCTGTGPRRNGHTFCMPLPDKLRIGNVVILTGKIETNATKTRVDLVQHCPYQSSSIEAHVDIRFDKSQIAVNCKHSGHWTGREILIDGPMEFEQGMDFTLIFNVTSKGYFISSQQRQLGFLEFCFSSFGAYLNVFEADVHCIELT